MMTLFKDFVRYMDTTYPKYVDRMKYTDLKYEVREEANKFVSEHEHISWELLEKVALYEFLQRNEEEVMSILGEYLDETITQSRGNGRRSR